MSAEHSTKICFPSAYASPASRWSQLDVLPMHLLGLLFRELLVLEVVGVAALEPEHDDEITRRNLARHAADRVFLVVRRLLQEHRLDAKGEEATAKRFDEADLDIVVWRHGGDEGSGLPPARRSS